MTTLPTADQVLEQRVGARLAEPPASSPAGQAPLPPLVPVELVTQQRVPSRLAGETLDQVPQALAAAKSTGALIAERAAEDASELNRFVETIAEFFDCPSLAADHVRIRMREPYRELRALAARLNAEAERRGAPLGQTAAAGRDAGGRFIRGAR